MSRCVFTDDARADIEQIHEYLAERNPQSALSVMGRIEDTSYLLADYPYMGVARPEYGATHRSFPIPRSGYVIIYRPIESGVEILHVRHGSQNLGRLFEQ